jgi:putative hemolysin
MAAQQPAAMTDRHAMNHAAANDGPAMMTPPTSGSPRAAGEALARIGNMLVRAAANAAEVEAAQRLRHQVFFAREDSGDARGGRDIDRHDAVCDHLLAIDMVEPGGLRSACGGRIVASYRLATPQACRAAGLPLYSQSEFDVESLLLRHPRRNFLELGRSCVLPQWRSKRTIELLWAGIWAHVRATGADVMVGCASLPGADPASHGEALGLLAAHAAAPAEWDAPALGSGKVCLGDFSTPKAETRAALRALPPLVKGYLRLGAWFAGEAVADPAFGTTDVLVVLPVERLNPRYVAYYGADAERHAPAGTPYCAV